MKRLARTAAPALSLAAWFIFWLAWTVQVGR